MKFTKTLQQVIGSLRRRAGVGETKTPTNAAFELRYDGLRVGYLTCSDGKWTFWYSDEFRRRHDLRPLAQFADVNEVYRSDRLWPFFLLRIPSMSQADVQAVLKREQIDAADEVALLRRSGRRTIAYPFKLVEMEGTDFPEPSATLGSAKMPEAIAS